MGGAEHRALAEISLDASERRRCLALVGQVFRYFEEWTEELLKFALVEINNRALRPYIKKRESQRA